MIPDEHSTPEALYDGTLEAPFAIVSAGLVASVEQDGYVVGGELRVGWFAGTGSDGCRSVFRFVELLDDCIRELADVGAVPLNDEFGNAGLPFRHCAGQAGVFVRWGGRETPGLEKLCDLALDSFSREDRDVVGEVFDGVEKTLILGDSNTDQVQVWIEKVGAVRGGGHPDLLESCGTRAMSTDIFRDGSEACPGTGAAGGEVGFVGVLVEELAGVAEDPLEVSLGGSSKGTIPMKWREVVLGSD